MLIQLTEEQKMLRDVAREFTKNEIAPRDKWMDENGFDWDLYKKIAEAGFMGANIPEQYGGGGGGIVDTTIIAEEFAKGSASVAPSTEPRIDILMVSSSGPTTLPKYEKFGWKMRARM